VDFVGDPEVGAGDSTAAGEAVIANYFTSPPNYTVLNSRQGGGCPTI